MARHFGPQHIANGYAAMSNHRNRPRYSGVDGRDVRAAIEAERKRAAKLSRIAAGKKKG